MKREGLFFFYQPRLYDLAGAWLLLFFYLSTRILFRRLCTSTTHGFWSSVLADSCFRAAESNLLFCHAACIFF